MEKSKGAQPRGLPIKLLLLQVLWCLIGTVAKPVHWGRNIFNF